MAYRMLHGAMALACLLSSAAPAVAGTIRLGGSTSALAVMERLGRAFEAEHPGDTVVIVTGLNSGGAIRAVGSGKLDLAASSRAPTAEEQAQGLVGTPYGCSPHVFAVAENAPVTGLTTAQLIGIYRGEIRSWPDGSRIRLLLTPADDPDTALLKRAVPALAAAVDEALARPGMVIDASDGVRADLLERTPGALGTSMLSLILGDPRRLKALPLDGVVPTPQTVAEGRYPLYKTFLLVTRPDPPASVAEFVSFVRSPTGRAILEQTGHSVAGEAAQ